MICISIIFYQTKNHTNFFLIYDIAYKTPYGAKPLPTIFDKVDIRKYDGIKYLAWFYSA